MNCPIFRRFITWLSTTWLARLHHTFSTSFQNFRNTIFPGASRSNRATSTTDLLNSDAEETEEISDTYLTASTTNSTSDLCSNIESKEDNKHFFGTGDGVAVPQIDFSSETAIHDLQKRIDFMRKKLDYLDSLLTQIKKSNRNSNIPFSKEILHEYNVFLHFQCPENSPFNLQPEDIEFPITEDTLIDTQNEAKDLKLSNLNSEDTSQEDNFIENNNTGTSTEGPSEGFEIALSKSELPAKGRALKEKSNKKKKNRIRKFFQNLLPKRWKKSSKK